eukprot:gnl/TRDRNA2_/TRDRNA2_131169_c0_seq1.p1 gnl/TRDRNA2_/TRDRNA2_131169_c0~~gnl/TRDRNA2_/TRDRNA2_131169_c0_seq1.p1  ORF type:complete len:125 (+),score=27.46 gnl/TRDRNA2_/TRDRNA2_131169_c0_seq1:202-576(+)
MKVLCYGLFGALPWFKWTQEVDWAGGNHEKSKEVAARVREAKFALIAGDWSSFGPQWSHLGQMPVPLRKYLECCTEEQVPSFTDYCYHYELCELLGGAATATHEYAEEDDVEDYQAELANILKA